MSVLPWAKDRCPADRRPALERRRPTGRSPRCKGLPTPIRLSRAAVSSTNDRRWDHDAASRGHAIDQDTVDDDIAAAGGQRRADGARLGDRPLCQPRQPTQETPIETTIEQANRPAGTIGTNGPQEIVQPLPLRSRERPVDLPHEGAGPGDDVGVDAAQSTFTADQRERETVAARQQIMKGLAINTRLRPPKTDVWPIAEFQ